MVTMPSEAASDPELVCALVAAGTDVWSAMIENLRNAERRAHRVVY